MQNMYKKPYVYFNFIKILQNGGKILAFFLSFMIQYKEKIRLQEDSRQERLQEKYEDCIDNAYKEYLSQWNSNCKILKMEDECSLPMDYSDLLEKRKNYEEKKCMEEYENGMR